MQGKQKGAAPKREERLARVEQGMKTAGVLGCTWAHYKDGQVVESEALGNETVARYKNGVLVKVDDSARDTLRETAPKLSVNKPQHIASLSKPVFAYLVLRMVEKGVLKLSDELYAYQPPNFFKEFPESQRGFLKDITVEMVLRHREGWVSPRKCALGSEPGESFTYSGFGFQWIQEILLKETGQTLEQLAQEYVFEDLGMSSSSYISPTDKESKSTDTFSGNAANSLHTTPEDYVKFVKACLAGKGLPKGCALFEFDSEFTMTKDTWACEQKIAKKDLEKLGWGLIFGLQKEGDVVKAWHNGDQNYTRAFVAFDVTASGIGDVFVYVCHSSSQLDNCGFALLETLLPEGLKLVPMETYMHQKLGFALNVREGWHDEQKAIMQKLIGKGGSFDRLEAAPAPKKYLQAGLLGKTGSFAVKSSGGESVEQDQDDVIKPSTDKGPSASQ